jgi:cyclohexyl-isocyanide hydratase
LAGESYAKAEQLNIEYDPDPPYQAGTPKGAGPRITNAMRRMYGGVVKGATDAAAQVKPA